MTRSAKKPVRLLTFAGYGLATVTSRQRPQFDNALDQSGTDERLEPSLDVFYRLTPSLNTALTVNTDLSATKVALFRW
jgi:hypothetical protein